MMKSAAPTNSLENSFDEIAEIIDHLHPDDKRPIGRYGRIHKEYLRQMYPSIYAELVRLDILWDYLASINEQAQIVFSLLTAEREVLLTHEQGEEIVMNKVVRRFQYQK